ncbi:hypothetical protein GCM10009001_25790 [Virgibacillus siamensis]|uniref:Uncharacterized protein n=2 Tax=Virgibacillus siamensis TaxID=480071 RepID=A0ABN1GA77_9BACI
MGETAEENAVPADEMGESAEETAPPLMKRVNPLKKLPPPLNKIPNSPNKTRESRAAPFCIEQFETTPNYDQ